MATHFEDELNEKEISEKRHYSKPNDVEDDDEEEEEEDDEEEEEDDDQNWDDWEVEDDAVEEEASASNPQLICLFCDSFYNSCSSLFQHCASSHHFDFFEIKKSFKLDFYKCFKLINYVRSQVAENTCWNCGMICLSKKELQNHLHESANFDGDIFPWNDDGFLKPFLQDDALLFSFGEDEEDEEDEAMTDDKKELETYLSQIECNNIHGEGLSNRCISKLKISCENGGKEILTSEKDINSEKHLEDDCRSAAAGISSDGRKHVMCTVPSTDIAANEIKNININYFGAYSSFGIHREMISDKARTDAYRQAILENPSLLRNAVVMDVGCGTGILSLFAAQAGASRVIAIEASDKMAVVATQIAKDNDLLRTGISGEGGKQSGVIDVIQGMVEELDNADHIKPHSVDVLLSEWMGYCLLYESMLSSVLFARDKWLKPGGAILPDTASMFVAGFGRGGTCLPFWENVYGFNMSCIGQEVVEDATLVPIVDAIDRCNIVTTTEVLQTFDLVTMQPREMDFTAEVELGPKLVTPLKNCSGSELEISWCYGIVLWFETGFTKRFCSEKSTILSTSPYDPTTHWSQTILTFREPIAMASNVGGEKRAAVGTNDCPAVRIQSRISIVRAAKHRSIDISMELAGIGIDGRKRSWPAQLFNLK